MTRTIFSALAVLALLLQPAALRAETAKEIIEKAIEAHGGAANLKKCTCGVVTAKGTLLLSGMEVTVEDETTYQLPNQLKDALTMDFKGKKITVITVFNDGKAKLTVDNRPMPLNDAQKAELKTTLRLQEMSDLYPLLDEKKFEISLLDKADKVGGKEVVGILVKSNQMKDVRMFFDKKTHVLLKMERKGLSPEGKEVDQAQVALEHEKIDGVLYPTKFETFMDGKKTMSINSVKYKRLDKVDPKDFDVSD